MEEEEEDKQDMQHHNSPHSCTGSSKGIPCALLARRNNEKLLSFRSYLPKSADLLLNFLTNSCAGIYPSVHSYRSIRQFPRQLWTYLEHSLFKSTEVNNFDKCLQRMSPSIFNELDNQRHAHCSQELSMIQKGSLLLQRPLKNRLQPDVSISFPESSSMFLRIWSWA